MSRMIMPAETVPRQSQPDVLALVELRAVSAVSFQPEYAGRETEQELQERADAKCRLPRFISEHFVISPKSG